DRRHGTNSHLHGQLSRCAKSARPRSELVVGRRPPYRPFPTSSGGCGCRCQGVLAVAGSLARKKIVPVSSGTFPTDGGLFVGLVTGVILITGGLTFLPALALGPIVEHLSMLAGTLY
ncbi:MAG: potassium-transporting ATPase subunit KdpA, partial [Rhodospirillales bacterium]|nr:potassium-transporting ATPase subunit KdpA [Rhodospirillales bacterium]